MVFSTFRPLHTSVRFHCCVAVNRKQVGTYNPLATRSGVKEVTFKVDRIRYWISVGAQPSDRVAWLLGQV